MLESLLRHVRQLTHFLFEEAQRSTDVVAADQAVERIAQAEQDERDRQEIAEYRRHFPGVAVPDS